MLGYAGQDAREAARKVRAQDELQRQDREIQEETKHLQEQQAKHEEVMRKMREKSAQAAEQRRAEHAEERMQEELRAAQWEASSILSEARRKEEKADRRLVEVYATGEAQGAAVAYVPEDGDRFGGVRGAGGSYRGYQEQRGGYYEQQRGGYQGGPKGGSKGGKGYQGGQGKGKMVRTGQVPGSKDFSGCSSCWSGAGLTCKDHSRAECSLYWETVVAEKSWKEGELWPGGRHHMGQVDAPTPEVVRMAQEADLAPKAATVTDREARGDAGIFEVSELDCEMVCVVLEFGETLYQPSH